MFHGPSWEDPGTCDFCLSHCFFDSFRIYPVPFLPFLSPAPDQRSQAPARMQGRWGCPSEVAPLLQDHQLQATGSRDHETFLCARRKFRPRGGGHCWRMWQGADLSWRRTLICGYGGESQCVENWEQVTPLANDCVHWLPCT